MSPSDRFQILALLLSFITVVVVPMLGLTVRNAVRWTKIELRVGEITKDLRAIVDDKNAVHLRIHQEMREDREATNRRLRWLEENLWNTTGKGSNAIRNQTER